MLGWRVQLCAARSLLEQGRLDAARQMLAAPPLCDFRPARELLGQVAEALAERAKQRVGAGLTAAGAEDLAAAAAAGAREGSLFEARQALSRRLVEEARGFLEAGDWRAGQQRLETLRHYGNLDAMARRLSQAAQHWEAAERARRQGRITDALGHLEQAAAIEPELPALQAALAACRHAASEVRTQLAVLHGALRREAWEEAFAAAQAILEVCPDHPEAGAALARAWSAAGLGGRQAEQPVRPMRGRGERPWQQGRPLPPSLNGCKCGAEPGLLKRQRTENTPLHSPSEQQALPQDRFMLWIDGVGGYLVCQASSLVIGQPDSADQRGMGGRAGAPAQQYGSGGDVAAQAGGRGADVPILADLSRRHCRIRRVGEDYVLDPLKEVRVNHRAVRAPTLLADGAELELTPGVRLRFRRPHPLCATARLEFISRHRTHPPADGVLLAAGTCILGAEPTAHILCKDWQRPVLLFQQADGWHVRYTGRFQLDGSWVEGEGVLGPFSRLLGEDFSFHLEPV